MSALPLQLVDDLHGLEALAPEWEALAAVGGDHALFRGPAWTLPWVRAYLPTFEGRPHVLIAREAGKLVGLAPLYERTARWGPGLKPKELRLLGDAGPRPPALDLLVLPGYEERFAAALVAWLIDEGHSWDVLDLVPLRNPSRARAHLAERLDGAGRKVDCHQASATLAVALAAAALDASALPPSDPHVRVYASDRASLEEGLAAMRRLSRLEWAAREEASPLADSEAVWLLRDVAATLGPRGAARLSRLDDEYGQASAVTLVVDDPPRAVCVAIAVDPERPRVAGRLLAAEARAAAERGMRALDVVVGAADVEMPPLPVSDRKSLRLRAFNNTAQGKLARTFASFRRRADAAREAPGAAAAGARAAWVKIRDAASSVATYERLHLYRGELFTGVVRMPPGLAVEELPQTAFEALAPAERTSVVERLELDEAYCRVKWRRGDLVVLARLEGRPAGIAWCARSVVHVPEIGREIRPGLGECYIHDVFVAPDARGRNVAPAMLEDLARRLRQRDVYRAWALIQPTNVASTRAFEKAAYASVADVVYARMAKVDWIVLRPPDPEGKRLLGIP